MLLGDTPSLKFLDTTLTRVLKGYRWELVVKEGGWNGGKTYVPALREGGLAFSITCRYTHPREAGKSTESM
jgi:hypothetical protein